MILIQQHFVVFMKAFHLIVNVRPYHLHFMQFYDIILNRFRDVLRVQKHQMLFEKVQNKDMNNIFPVTVIILLGLIVILLITIIYKLIMNEYKKGAFFCFLPHNHTALVELSGKPIRWLMHRSDKEATISTIEEMHCNGSITTAEYTEVKNRVIDRIVVRDEGLCGTLVKLFNLHLISVNPFARIKPIEVVKNGLKDSYDPNSPLSSHMRPTTTLSSSFLRLAWPRTNFIPEVELMDQVKINLIAAATKIRVWNLHKIYYEFSGKVSEMVDGAIASAFIQHLGNIDLNKFQTENMTARIGTGSLLEQLRGKGLESVGAYLEGGVAVSDWELGVDQKRIRDANLAHAAVQAEKLVAITEAEGLAEALKIKGQAEANVISLRGTAFAEANKKLVEAYGSDSKAASNVAVAQELSKPGSNVRAIGGNTILNIGE